MFKNFLLKKIIIIVIILIVMITIVLVIFLKKPIFLSEFFLKKINKELIQLPKINPFEIEVNPFLDSYKNPFNSQ
jgi:uncharacterized protein YxeA